MKCKELLYKLEEIMPLSYAMSWDNVGLLVGRSEKEIKNIIIALDVTDDVIKEAIDMKSDLIITHHPMIFSALKQIRDTDIVGKRVLELARNDISYIAMHTNYDVSIDCMGDIAAKMLGIEGAPIEITGIDEVNNIPIGIGKVGKLKRAVDLNELAAHIKSIFELDFVRVYGSDILGGKIDTVAISPGSGKGMYKNALACGAKVLITGDITHHEGIDAKEEGIAIIDAGHYGIEKIFIHDIEKKLLNINKSLNIKKIFSGTPDIIL